MPLHTDLTEWLWRIEAEYREMPGLQLTERQMQRLWGLDGQTCAEILAALVALVPTALLWYLDCRRPLPGHCRCGYNLTGLTSPRCPECGAEVTSSA